MLQRANLHAISLLLALAVVFSDIQPGYLDFDNLPETNFSCEGKVIGGYYADVETGCQMFHVCTIGQKGEVSDIKFLCLNGTVFDQETRVCERIDEVDCDKSEDFFNLNLELYGNTANFGTQECGDEECEEKDTDDVDDTEYDDDTESTTIITTSTTTVRTTTTSRPTTVRTTHSPPATPPRTRYSTQGPDSISALLALHNAFNQGLNRRPILSSNPTTRLPSLSPPTTTTRRLNIPPLTLRTRFDNTDHRHQDHHHGYNVFRPTFRPTFQPSFTSSLQTPLKSNYHTFESGDIHFAHSFDPEKPYNFQYFAQKSSPSPFTVRIEPQVSVVTSTSTSTSIKIANTTVDEFPYEDYEDVDPFFHDIPKIARPKRSTTRHSQSRSIATNPFGNRLFGGSTPSGFTKQNNTHSTEDVADLQQADFHSNKTSPINQQKPSGFIRVDTTTQGILSNFDQVGSTSQDAKTSSSDHVIKIDQSDVVLAKNYTTGRTEQKSEYLHNMLDSIALENNDKEQVLNLFRNSESEMEQLMGKKGVNMMLEKLENKLLEMELEGQGAGIPFEYEGDSLEIREKRGSDNQSRVGGMEQQQPEMEGSESERWESFACLNPAFCSEIPGSDEVVQLEIEDRRKRDINRTRVARIRVDNRNVEGNDSSIDENIDLSNSYKKIKSQQRTTETPHVKTTKKNRRKNSRQNQNRRNQPSNRNGQNVKPKENVSGRSKTVWDSTRKQNDKERATTKRPEIKPVTEEIEGDITTVEYRRPPLKLNGKSNKHSFIENTTPFTIIQSTRLQTRFEYSNRNIVNTQNSNITVKAKSYPTQEPAYNKHVPVHEEDDYAEPIEISKTPKKSHVQKRSPIIIRDDSFSSDDIDRYNSKRDATSSLDQFEPRTEVHTLSNLRQFKRQETGYRDEKSLGDYSGENGQQAQARQLSHSVDVNRPVFTPFEDASKPKLSLGEDVINYEGRRTKSKVRHSFNQGELNSSNQNPGSGNGRSKQRLKTRPNQSDDYPSRTISNGRNVGQSQDSRRGRGRGHTDHHTPSRTTGHIRSDLIDDGLISGVQGGINLEPLDVRRVEIQTGSVMRQIHRTSNDNRSNLRGHMNPNTHVTSSFDNSNYSNQGRGNIQQDNRQPSSRAPFPQQNTSVKRRKIIKNKVELSERPEIQSSAPHPDNIPPRHHIPSSNQQFAPIFSKEVQHPVEESGDVTTTAAPITPYNPGPGIEQDPNFSCRGKVKGGLYADVHADCHGFFICSQARRGISATHFWCGVGTKFNQKSRTCVSEALVDCSLAPRLYYLNDNQFNPSIDIEEKLRGSFEPMRVQ